MIGGDEAGVNKARIGLPPGGDGKLRDASKAPCPESLSC